MRFLARAAILTNGWKRGLRFLLVRWLDSRGPGLAMHRKMVNDRWKAVLQRAGITCDRYHLMHVTRQETCSHTMPDDRVWTTGSGPAKQ